MKNLMVSTLVFWAVATSGNVAQAKCTEVIECANEIMEQNVALRALLETRVPKGAIMAFNLKECPAGWSRFGAANGRFLLGAANPDELGKAEGRADIPNGGGHKHPVQQGHAPGGGRFGNDNADDHWHTGSAGDHNHGGNNMPPFLTVSFCTRD